MIRFFLDLWDSIVMFFTSPEFSRGLLVYKLLSWFISFFLIYLIIVLLKKSDAGWWVREAFNSRRIAYGNPNQRWENIVKRFSLGDDANMKLAIIEADNLMDEILKLMSLPGENMGERMKQFEKHELASIDQLWEAHKLRNRIVHEPGLRLMHEEAQKALEGYEAALKELEYL